MDQIKISIVIPTFNEAEGIIDLLDYIKSNNAGYVYEFLVVDGGSKDKTTQLARMAGARLVNCTNKDRSQQMHEGAQIAGGNVLYFLHADTFPPRNFDELIANTVVAGFRWGRFRLTFNQDHGLLAFIAWFTRFNWPFYTFGDQSLFVHKETYFSLGGFNVKMRVFEDTDLGRRLARDTKGKVIREAVTTSSRRFGENGLYRLSAIYIYLLICYLLGVSNQVIFKHYKILVRNVLLNQTNQGQG